jgi:hypothetical protein
VHTTPICSPAKPLLPAHFCSPSNLAGLLSPAVPPCPRLFSNISFIDISQSNRDVSQ